MTAADFFIIERLFCLRNRNHEVSLPLDVTRYIISALIKVVTQAICQGLEKNIPLDVIEFVHFHHGKVDVLEIKIDKRKIREQVHLFCRSHGLFTNTKWERTVLTRKCPKCGHYTEDIRRDENGCEDGAYCYNCPDSDEEQFGVNIDLDCVGSHGRSHLKYRHESTGEMLIRRCATIPYKKTVTGSSTSYRKYRRRGK